MVKFLEYLLPTGATLSTGKFNLGPLPVRVGAEFQYYPITPEVAGPQFNLRLTLTPVILAPEWSKRPLF